MWLGGVIHARPPATQKAVMEVVISDLGGTAQAMAEKVGVSRRTVESWRSGASPLPIRVAYRIAEDFLA